MATLLASFFLGIIVVFVGAIVGIVIVRKLMYKSETYKYNQAFQEENNK